MAARRAYNALLRRQVEENGGVIIREKVGYNEHGRRVVRSRTVETFAPPKGRRPTDEASEGSRRGSHVRARPRGAGRPKAQSTRSSARSGDSGPDSESSKPPQVGRLCICGCGRDISDKRAGAIYFDPEACRKRYQRGLDRAHPDRVVARKLKRLAAAERLDELTADELPAGCRCPGQGFERDPEGVPVCVPCGRPLTIGVRLVNGYDARLAEVRSWMRNDQAETRRVHRPRVSRKDWRTRPTRALSTKLRKTRKTRKTRKVAA
jgi:hypothetical protein